MFFNRVWETLLWGSGEKRELFLCSLCEVCVCVLSFGGGCCFSVLPRVFLILRSRLGKNKSQATQWIKTNKQQQQKNFTHYLNRNYLKFILKATFTKDSEREEPSSKRNNQGTWRATLMSACGRKSIPFRGLVLPRCGISLQMHPEPETAIREVLL